MTPGIQPRTVKINTITMEPHPLSITESGGNIIAKITLQILINKMQVFKFLPAIPKIGFISDY